MGHLLKILLLTPLEKYDSNINENVSVSPVTMCKYKLFDFFFLIDLSPVRNQLVQLSTWPMHKMLSGSVENEHAFSF